jgi:hypothetical protein
MIFDARQERHFNAVGTRVWTVDNDPSGSHQNDRGCEEIYARGIYFFAHLYTFLFLTHSQSANHCMQSRCVTTTALHKVSARIDCQQLRPRKRSIIHRPRNRLFPERRFLQSDIVPGREST